MELTFHLVLRQIPRTFLFFLSGIILGIIVGYALFNINKGIFEDIIKLWSTRILFGFNLMGSSWFMINNLIAILIIILAFILILGMFYKTPKHTRRFNIERNNPKITLFGLYIIPFGASLINGFFLSLFSIYILLNFGLEKFAIAVLLQYPHGIVEIPALILASSLALAYIEIVRPLVLKADWKKCVSKGKELIFSRVTLFFVIVILILIIFSGFIERMLASTLF
jgi:uncharacterized membrane protein SpoIIM required for sporulation